MSSLLGVLLVAFGVVTAAYAYVAYPLLLRLLRRGRWSLPPAPPSWPMITVTLPVRNEEAVIRDTLDAILGADYPADRRHVLVISDASTDATDQIVSEYAARGAVLLRLPERRGKTAAENAARQDLKGEIVVNTDASVRVHRGGLKALVRALEDPSVGVASGCDVSVGPDRRTNVGEAGYVGYEMWVRDLETAAGGIVGASGCFFACRKALHLEIVPEALSRDFAAPLIARERGYRSVSVREAVCFVPRTSSPHQEYRRKVRTMTRGLETLFYKRHLLNPFRYGRFAWMLFSHKLARWLVPIGALSAVVGLGLLSVGSPGARLVLTAGMLVGAIAAVGWYWTSGRAPRLVTATTYAVTGIVAGVEAWVRAVRGELSAVWEPTRRDTIASA